MAEEAVVAAETAEAPVAEKTEKKESTPREKFSITKTAPKSKEDLYRQVQTALNDLVTEKRGPGRQVFGDQHAHDIVTGVFAGFVGILLQTDKNGQAQECSVGIPAGYGSLQLGTAAPTTKRTPQGQVVSVPRRWRAVWRPGKAVEDLLDALPPPPQDAPKAAEAAPEASA